MDESIKQGNNENELEEVAPATEKHSLGGALGTLATMGLVDVLAHLGPTGLVIGGIASYVVWKHGPEVYEQAGVHLPLPTLPHMKRKSGGRSFWDRALGRYPQVIDATTDAVEQEEDDPVFAASNTASDVPDVPRITVEQIAAHVERNSYEVYIGRSMSRPHNPAVKINFFKRHLKLIGASQHGKSSMAAALLDTITRSHDPELVQIALLDLEDKTGRLFTHLPHIARVRKHGETIGLHAHSYEQVAQYLGHISALIDYRYSLSGDELERQPLLIVYLEEFVDLKDYFKQRALAAERDEREQAKQDYAQLVYTIKKIAARGLKVLVQLLMCAQVDYRDDDLQSALVNVTSGMSFCVRPSAAQAAGFYQSELLSRNAKEDKIGQAVVEMPDCKDLILAPDYDLESRLKALGGTAMLRQHRRSVQVGRVEMLEQEESAVPEEILRAVPSPYSEREEEEVSEKQPALSPKLQLALTLYQSGKVTINDLATAMTAQGKYGKVSASEAYNLLGLLDEMGYITRNRKVKSEG
jgi:hypothetical protein